MPESARRRITMFDALILVAATAVGFAPIRTVFSALVTRRHTLPQALSKGAFRAADVRAYIRDASEILVPMLFAWSVADVALCLRRPRPSLQRLARQPGVVAALVASVWGTLTIAEVLAQMAADSVIRVPPVPEYIVDTLQDMLQYVGPAVSGAWLALALCGRWRPEPTWIDRLGRGLGAGWFAIYLFPWIGVFL